MDLSGEYACGDWYFEDLGDGNIVTLDPNIVLNETPMVTTKTSVAVRGTNIPGFCIGSSGKLPCVGLSIGDIAVVTTITTVDYGGGIRQKIYSTQDWVFVRSTVGITLKGRIGLGQSLGPEFSVRLLGPRVSQNCNVEGRGKSYTSCMLLVNVVR
jgi:hypothetical protein